MTVIFTAEIEDRAIYTFASDAYLEAKNHAASEAFHADLLWLEHQGKPLWDGVSQIVVRQANDDEQATWKEAQAQAIEDGKLYVGDDDLGVYLVTVSDPAGDHFTTPEVTEVMMARCVRRHEREPWVGRGCDPKKDGELVRVIFDDRRLLYRATAAYFAEIANDTGILLDHSVSELMMGEWQADEQLKEDKRCVIRVGGSIYGDVDCQNKKRPMIRLYYDGSNETLACYSYNSKSDELERMV